MKFKMKKEYYLYAAIAVVMLLFLLKPKTEMALLPNASGSTPSGGGGGGGGGGDGTTETAPPDDGFICTTCESNFLVGNPTLVTNRLSGPSVWNYISPRTKPQGHWNCEGTCMWEGAVATGYNCVPDPTNEIPENGYDDITGDRPDCWCLKQNPGECNFYDANFGSGIDNQQCGGSCPVGSVCTSWTDGAKQHCECTEESGGPLDCGWQALSPLLTKTTGGSCYGECPSNQVCSVVTSTTRPDECKCIDEQGPIEEDHNAACRSNCMASGYLSGFYIFSASECDLYKVQHPELTKVQVMNNCCCFSGSTVIMPKLTTTLTTRTLATR